MPASASGDGESRGQLAAARRREREAEKAAKRGARAAEEAEKAATAAAVHTGPCAASLHRVFSYGSNGISQLRARVKNPGLTAAPAVLQDYTLAFCNISQVACLGFAGCGTRV